MNLQILKVGELGKFYRDRTIKIVIAQVAAHTTKQKSPVTWALQNRSFWSNGVSHPTRRTNKTRIQYKTGGSSEGRLNIQIAQTAKIAKRWWDDPRKVVVGQIQKVQRWKVPQFRRYSSIEAVVIQSPATTSQSF
jgi:hypothetical protein